MAGLKQKVLDKLQKNPYVTAKDLSRAVGSSTQGVATVLRQLLNEDKIIKKVSAGDAARYYLKEQLAKPAPATSPAPEPAKPTPAPEVKYEGEEVDLRVSALISELSKLVGGPVVVSYPLGPHTVNIICKGDK